MKQLLTANYFPIFLVLLIACKKDSGDTKPAEPSVTSVTWSASESGGVVSTVFNVSIVADSSKIAELRLYQTSRTKCWTIKKPTTGNYTMYGRPGYAPIGYYYFFSFIKNDSTEIDLPPFHVN